METLNNKTKWSDVSKANPFGVPEHYFEDVSLRVADRIASQKRGAWWSFAPVWQVARPILAAAVVIFGCFFAVNHLTGTQDSSQYASQSQSAEVVDRLLYMNNLADAMDSDDFFAEETTEVVSEEISEEEMMYYLLNGNVQMGDIISMMYDAE